MGSGIRATVTFTAPDGCPITEFAASADAVVDRTSRSVAGSDSPGTVTEFMGPADADFDDGDPVFSYGNADVYRIAPDAERSCPCACLGEFGCAVHRYVADGGELTLVFHAADFETLQDVMAAFRERFDDVDVQRLLRPPLEGSPEDRVFVNLGRLTDRQFEALATAYELGYFERPRRANATEIAEELGISQSTLTEHLVAAQRKLLGDVFEDGE